MATTDTCCTLVPYFKIHPGKVQEFRALVERFVAATKEEPACLYYGYSFDGDTAHCREGYRDAEGLLAHAKNVGPLLEELVKIADVVRFEVHGPEEELAKLRGPFADLKLQYFRLEYGFRR
jgi:quinol monooxygenase YgiN